MSDYTCAKCHGTQYDRGEIRTEGGWLSGGFPIEGFANRAALVGLRQGALGDRGWTA